MKVLIVEDDPIIRLILAHHLKSAGFNVILSENGELGLTSYQSNKSEIGLIITDLMMPELDGYAMAQKIRSDSEGVPIPIIAITAGIIDQSAAKNDVFNSIFQKPLDIKSLLSLSELLINGRK